MPCADKRRTTKVVGSSSMTRFYGGRCDKKKPDLSFMANAKGLEKENNFKVTA
jgi:hypothetical protein